MKLFTVAAVLGLAAPAFSYSTYTLSYDTTYDDGQNSLSSVTCSNGEHGLLTQGYTSFEDLPTFPNIGKAPQIRGWDSQYCGSCWELTYTDSYGNPKSLNFTAIDAGESKTTFTISLEGMDYLTQDQGKTLKNVPITVARKTASACGL